MPGLSSRLEASDDSGLDTRPELFKMMLPSQLASDSREYWCLPGLPDLEARFWNAQAEDALAEIHRLRQLFQGLSFQNRKHISSSQHTVTRAKGTFERYKVRISRFAALYRQAQRALVTLDPKGGITEWKSRLLELKDADIRGPGREEHETSEGRTIPSWIWGVSKKSSKSSNAPTDDDADITKDDSNVTEDDSNVTKDNPEHDDLPERAASGEEIALSIRAHWARCQARAERYEEEAELTVEEMRRTLEFFKWKSRWWLSLQNARSNSATPPDPQVAHGLRAYAHRQASVYSSLVSIYLEGWRKCLVENSLGGEWLALYPTITSTSTESTTSEGTDEPLGDSEDETELDSEVPADPEFEERFSNLPGS